jgi:membrane-associated protease RseP (regulator of RpoE activity)
MLLRTPLPVAKSSLPRWSPAAEPAAVPVIAGLLVLAALLGGPAPGAFPRAFADEPQKKEEPKKEPRPRLPLAPLPGNDIQDLMEFRDALQKSLERLRQQQRGLAGAPVGGARLGIHIETPSPTLVDQLDLPQGEGLVVLDVLADSAAAAAGLKPHDILLEFDGKPVPADGRAFIKMLEGVKPGVAVEVTILRKGRKETIKGVTLPEGKPTLPRPLLGAGR